MREFKDKWVKTRKEHLCCWCGESFPPGTRMRNWVGIDEVGYWGGGFTIRYICEKCNAELFADGK